MNEMRSLLSESWGKLSKPWVFARSLMGPGLLPPDKIAIHREGQRHGYYEVHKTTTT